MKQLHAHMVTGLLSYARLEHKAVVIRENKVRYRVVLESTPYASSREY